MTREEDFGCSVTPGYGAPTGMGGELAFAYRNIETRNARIVTFAGFPVAGNHAFTSELETLSLIASGYYRGFTPEDIADLFGLDADVDVLRRVARVRGASTRQPHTPCDAAPHAAKDEP